MVSSKRREITAQEDIKGKKIYLEYQKSKNMIPRNRGSHNRVSRMKPRENINKLRFSSPVSKESSRSNQSDVNDSEEGLEDKNTTVSLEEGLENKNTTVSSEEGLENKNTTVSSEDSLENKETNSDRILKLSFKSDSSIINSPNLEKPSNLQEVTTVSNEVHSASINLAENDDILPGIESIRFKWLKNKEEQYHQYQPEIFPIVPDSVSHIERADTSSNSINLDNHEIIQVVPDSVSLIDHAQPEKNQTKIN